MQCGRHSDLNVSCGIRDSQVAKRSGLLAVDHCGPGNLNSPHETSERFRVRLGNVLGSRTRSRVPQAETQLVDHALLLGTSLWICIAQLTARNVPYRAGHGRPHYATAILHYQV